MRSPTLPRARMMCVSDYTAHRVVMLGKSYRYRHRKVHTTKHTQPCIRKANLCSLSWFRYTWEGMPWRRGGRKISACCMGGGGFSLGRKYFFFIFTVHRRRTHHPGDAIMIAVVMFTLNAYACLLLPVRTVHVTVYICTRTVALYCYPAQAREH